MNQKAKGVSAVVFICLFCGITGMLTQSWVDGSERDNWQAERKVYLERFPIVRAEERAACTATYDAKLDTLRKVGIERDKREAEQTIQLQEQRKLLQKTNDLVAYTLRFLGDRAKVTDQVLQTVKVTEQKTTVAAVKADEAASAITAVNKKLDGATHAPLPASPWAGKSGGH